MDIFFKKLVLFFVFFVFLFSSSFSLDQDNCFMDGDLKSNSIVNLNANYVCMNAFNFSSINNLTIICDGNTLKSDNYDFNDAENIFFDGCYLISNGGVKNISDNLVTQVYFKNSGFGNYNMSLTKGNYSYVRGINFNILDELSVPLDIYDIYLESKVDGSINYVLNNTGLIDLFYFQILNGVNISYRNYLINVSSEKFGTFNFSNNMDILNHSLIFTLKDINNPIVNIIPEYSSLGIIFKLSTDEIISNGSIEILEMNSTLLTFLNITTDSTSFEIENQSLVDNTTYKLNILLNDRFGNSYFKLFYYYFYNFDYLIDSGETISFIGDPQNTTSFNFSSSNYNIEIEFLESVNLSDELNFSNFIVIEDNLVSIDDVRFNKSAKLHFNSLSSYSTIPFVLRNGILCSGYCSNFLFNITTNDFSFDVSSFSNYSIVSNSVLNFTGDIGYTFLNSTFKVNYSRYNDSVPILGVMCVLNLNGTFYNLTYDSISKYYIYDLYYENVGNYPYNVNCYGNSSYDPQIISGFYNFEFQEIDNFTTFNDFERKPGFEGSKITVDKNISVNISSFGTNNTAGYFNTSYSFLISKNIAYPQDNWDTIHNLTSWINVGKSEYFEIYNDGISDYTNYKLSNGSIFNFSEYIFIDERDNNGDGTSLYVNVRACVPGGFCKYFANSENNILFEDTTRPELVIPINISSYYNSDSFVNFGYFVRDLESEVDFVKFGVCLNSSNIVPNISLLFDETMISYYNYSINLDEGNFYKIVMDTQNKVISNPIRYFSSEFLIDTIEPYNSSFNLTINENNYHNSSLVNMTFFAGTDYNINYSSLNLTESGLDYMEISYKQNDLNSDVCNLQIGNIFTAINETFDVTNISYIANLTSGYCYNFRYDVYDLAGNVNYLYFDEILKIDTTEPIIGTVQGIDILDYTASNPNGAENIEKDFGELTLDTTLFEVMWNIYDGESDIDYYDVELIDNTTGAIVLSLTNYTSSIFVVKYNESYILDNHNYKVRVSGFNKAGFASNSIITNGATVFINKIPKLKYDTPYLTFDKKLIDSTDNGISTFNFDEFYRFNITCKVYDYDTGFLNNSGILCNSFDGGVSCDFNTNLGINNYYVSCMSDESIKFDRTYNDVTDNLDIEILVEENIVPTVENVSSNVFNLYENEIFSYEFVTIDNNTFSHLIGDINYNHSQFKINFTGSNLMAGSTLIRFILNSTIDTSYLDVVDYLNLGIYRYDYYFNSSINLSSVVSLCLNDINCYLNFENVNSSYEINNTYFINFLNTNTDYVDGVSNIAFINNIGSIYNFSTFGNEIFLNISETGVRNGLINFNLTIGDGLQGVVKNFTLNISPLRYPVFRNESYYLLNNNFSILQNNLFELNVSKYFYEMNVEVGLNDSLTYSIFNNYGLNIIDFNFNSGMLYLESDNSLNFSLGILVTDLFGTTKDIILDFVVLENVDNVSPSLSVLSPIGIILSDKKLIFVDIVSDENLSSLNLNVGNYSYDLCNDFCDGYVENLTIFNLVEGINNISFTAIDFAGNQNITYQLFNFTFDSDSDLNPDFNESDLDADGINDSVDDILGGKNSIYSSFNIFNFSINGTDNLTINYSSIVNVSFDVGNISYVEMQFDFVGNNSIDLRDTRVVYDSLENIIFVGGFEAVSSSKSILLPKISNENYSSVCIKDSEVLSIGEMSNSCNLPDESLIDCSLSNSCNLITVDGQDFFKIIGLSHSVVKLLCTENWQVGSWSACSGGVQSRDVMDLNNCETDLTKPVSTQVCTVSSSGGSSGGGSGGSSSSSYVPLVVINDTDIDEGNKTVENIIEEIPTSIGKFDIGNFERNLVIDTLYSFIFDSKIYAGNFILVDGVLNFESEKFKIVFVEGVIDLDGDGIYDLNISKINLDGSNLYFLGSSILNIENGEVIIQKVDEDIGDDFNAGRVVENSNNFNYLLLFGSIFFILICVGVGYGIYNFRKNKNYVVEPLKNFSSNDNSNNNDVEIKDLISDINYKLNSIDAKKDYFGMYSNKLIELSELQVNLMTSEKELLSLVKSDVKFLVNKGYSWTSIYYYLKSKNVSNFFIKKIINFDFLINNFELFINSDNFNNLTGNDLKTEFLKQPWSSYCYIYDGNGIRILEDILFMLAGVKIYGFKKKKFSEVLNDELNYGISKFKTHNFNFNDFENDINLIMFLKYQDDFLEFKNKFLEFKTELEKSEKLTNTKKQELIQLVEKLEEKINLVLK